MNIETDGETSGGAETWGLNMTLEHSNELIEVHKNVVLVVKRNFLESTGNTYRMQFEYQLFNIQMSLIIAIELGLWNKFNDDKHSSPFPDTQELFNEPIGNALADSKSVMLNVQFLKALVTPIEWNLDISYSIFKWASW